MATDPVQSIRRRKTSTPFGDELPAAMTKLAALPPSVAVPYLTLYLDWAAAGNEPARRPGRLFFNQQAEHVLAGLEPHTPPHESVSADLARIGDYLETGIDPATKGLVVVARAAGDVFEIIPLPNQVENRLVAGPTPALFELARLDEDAPAFAVLLADQRDATMLVVDQTVQEQLEVEGSEYPRKQQQGGWSQRRYQQRADERVEAFVRAVAGEVRRDLTSAPVDLLILAGEARIASLLAETLHPSIQEIIVGTIPLDIRSTEQELIAAATPVITRAERGREAAIVGRIENGIGPGGGAVVGPVDTLTALQAGQVMALAINDDFTAPGWADYTLPLYGAGPVPAQHPAGGDPANLIAIALEEELVRLALVSAAGVEVVKSTAPIAPPPQAGEPRRAAGAPRQDAARKLDKLGGVGALLRFALSQEQATADL